MAIKLVPLSYEKERPADTQEGLYTAGQLRLKCHGMIYKRHPGRLRWLRSQHLGSE